MSQKNVLLLFGGCSPEHEISKASAAAIISALNNYTVIPTYITEAGKWLMYDGKLDNLYNLNWEKFGTPAILSPDRVNGGLLRMVGDKVKAIPIDVVLPIFHGPNGEDGTIQGLCELAGIPYVGCGVMASAVAMDKAVTRLVAKALKIPQTDYLVFSEYELVESTSACLTKVSRKLGYPCFVKPSVGGSAIGVSKANNRKELEAAICEALKFHDKVIIEKFVKGREIEIGVLGVGMAAKVSVTGEVIASNEFYDYDAKYTNDTAKIIVPADVPEDISREIRRQALEIYTAAGCRGLARADFFLEQDGGIIFNEINTMPGFTDISQYPMLWRATGMSYSALVDRLIDLALGDENE